MAPLDIRFTISAEQRDLLADGRIVAQRRRVDRSRAWSRHRRVRQERFLRRWSLWLFFVLPLVATFVLIYFLHPRRIGEVGAAAFVCVLYFCLWRCVYEPLLAFGSRWSRRHAKRQRGKYWRASESVIRGAIAVLEGQHKVSLTPESLTLVRPRCKAITLPWGKLIRLDDLAGFYQFSTPLRVRLRVSYFVAKQTDDMSQSDYELGLQYLLQRVRRHMKQSQPQELHHRE